MRKLVLFTVLLTAILLPLSAQDGGDDTNSDGKPDRWVIMSGGLVGEIRIDRDYNGEVDYIVIYDSKSEKKEEILDFNFDGVMDDYYFYSSGKMIRREIDTNFDGKIDVWVYLDGIYIQKYEKDTDFDGVIDVTKDYTGE